MEYGPRSLGNRSILALPNSKRIRDLLNLRLKMRVWYQPFCPSMLEEDALTYLDQYNGVPNRFMTMGYMVKDDLQEEVEGVISVDGSCRPQIIPRHGIALWEAAAGDKKPDRHRSSSQYQLQRSRRAPGLLSAGCPQHPEENGQ